jgi:hypothetical protein
LAGQKSSRSAAVRRRLQKIANKWRLIAAWREGDAIFAPVRSVT